MPIKRLYLGSYYYFDSFNSKFMKLPASLSTLRIWAKLIDQYPYNKMKREGMLVKVTNTILCW